jgi:alkylhydroperoxidase/carboxymuconolactone decarboxylase family protein YurZ
MEAKSKETAPDFRRLHQDLVTHVLKGNAYSSEAERHAAFNDSGLTGPLKTLIDKVANCSHKVTDDDIAAVKGSGISEDQIFELVVCAAVGRASRQYANGLRALEEVVTDRKGGQYAP